MFRDPVSDEDAMRFPSFLFLPTSMPDSLMWEQTVYKQHKLSEYKQQRTKGSMQRRTRLHCKEALLYVIDYSYLYGIVLTCLYETRIE